MKFDADLSTVDTGVWGEFEGSKFLIAHISNMRFQRALSRLQQPHRRKIESGQLDPETNRSIVCKAMAEGILLDWTGVTMKDGKEVTYNSGNAYQVLMGNPEFRDWVSEFATNLANFRANEVEEVGKS